MRIVLPLTLTMALFMADTSIAADTVYKVVGPDGSVAYTDRPPAAGSTSRMEFHNLPASPLPETALKFRAEIEKILRTRAAALKGPAPEEFRIFTAQWCPHCRRAKAHLQMRGIAFIEYDIDTTDGMAAFVQASGRAVPLLVTGAGRLQGYSGESYDRFLEARQRR